MKRFFRTALMSVKFMFLILLPLAVTMEQEYCMPEDYTNVAIPFRMVYEGKFNLGKSLFLLLIHIKAIHCFFNVSMSFLQQF
jgi:hypothetical protein